MTINQTGFYIMTSISKNKTTFKSDMRKISTIEVYCYYFLLVVLFGTLQEMTDFYPLMNSTKYRGLCRNGKKWELLWMKQIMKGRKNQRETYLKMQML